jgi:hypothetical protein
MRRSKSKAFAVVLTKQAELAEFDQWLAEQRELSLARKSAVREASRAWLIERPYRCSVSA